MLTKERIIETERLYSRDFTLADFAAVHEYGQIPEFSQYEQWGPNTEPHSMQFIEQSIVKAKHNPRFDYEMAVILKDTEQLIGSARIARET